MPVAVEVYDADAPWSTLVRSCTEDTDRHAQDVLNDVGDLSFVTAIGSLDAAALTRNSVVKFRDLDTGGIVFSGRLGPRSQDTVADGEEAAQNTTVAAPGSLTILKDATVNHHAGSGALSKGADARTFGFASLDYTAWLAAPWVAATELFKQNDVLSGYGGGRNPRDWPDPDAWWIWSRPLGGGSPPMPIGSSFFRKQVTISTAGDYAIWIAADDGFVLWINGIKIKEQTQAYGWQTGERIPLFLEAGTYDIAVEGINVTRPSPSTNAAAFILTMWSLKDGGAIDTNVCRSDSSWQALDYPASPPGLTPGAIMKILIDEAKADGLLWALHGALAAYDFSALVDSLGVAWATEVDLLPGVGRTLLEVALDLAAHSCDLGFDHDLMRVRMVNRGGWNSGAAISFTAGTDIFTLHQEDDPAYATRLRAKLADGTWVILDSGTGTANSGSDPIKEAFFDAGTAESVAAATLMAQGLFDRHANDMTVCTLRLYPSAGKRPWVNFWPGKAITLPALGGGTAAATIQDISIDDRGASEDGVIGGTQEVTAELLQ